MHFVGFLVYVTLTCLLQRQMGIHLFNRLSVPIVYSRLGIGEKVDGICSNDALGRHEGSLEVERAAV